MVEPLDANPTEAQAHAAAIENTLLAAGITLEQVHRGDGIASWAVNRRAIPRGHGIRTGLEDTRTYPTGVKPKATETSSLPRRPCYETASAENPRLAQSRTAPAGYE